jgi:hypothetical protein
MTVTVTLILLLMGASCASDGRNFIAAEFSDDTPLEMFSLDPFEEPIGYSMVFGDVMERVIQRFGEPKETTTEYEFDRYGGDGAKIRLSTLYYPDLIIKIGSRPRAGESWLNGIEITGKQYRLKSNLGVGASHQDILTAFQPDNYVDEHGLLKIRMDIWEKRYGECPEHDSLVNASVRLVFEFDAADRVVKINWIPEAGH